MSGLELGFLRFSSPPTEALGVLLPLSSVMPLGTEGSDCVPVLVASSCVEVDALLFRIYIL